MPNNYNGDATDAHFDDAIPVIQDGEVWQYGDEGSGVFGMLKPIIDRIAYLRQYAGLLVASTQTWLGDNIFNGAGKSFVLGSALGGAGLNCAVAINGATTVSSSGSFTVADGGNFTTSDGSSVIFHGAQHVQGDKAARGNRVFQLADADVTMDGTTVDIIRVPQLTADRTLTLSIPPDGTPNCTLQIFWYSQGSHQTGRVNPVNDVFLGPATSASTHNLSIISNAGNFALGFGKPADVGISNDTASLPVFWSATLVWNGSDWECIALQTP